jgi:hypothetical protein
MDQDAGIQHGHKPAQSGASHCTVGVIMSFSLGFLARGEQFLEVIGEGYGIPCGGQDCDKSVESLYENLRQELQPDDVVLSSRPTVTYHYLGKADLLLREKTVEVEILEREEHLGLPVIDSIDEMSELLRSDKKVWVIGHSNIKDVLDEPVYNYINHEFQQFHSDPLLTIYVNHLE